MKQFGGRLLEFSWQISLSRLVGQEVQLQPWIQLHFGKASIRLGSANMIRSLGQNMGQATTYLKLVFTTVLGR